ncbi:hypothetical protein C4571_01570 [Candidatus Parcubacteria bacterium]|nr:MAG: hypothetical protein C4571_01570 [Candidatus Parcubacteria bacterium]
MTTRWIEIGLGVWIIVSPWILGFSSISIMKWSNVIVGMCLVLLHVWMIFGEKGDRSQGSVQ